MKDLSTTELVVVVIILLFLIAAITVLLVRRRVKEFRIKEVTLKTPMVEATLEPVEEKEKGKSKPKRKPRQTPREDRSVNVKGSANGAVITTGDNNKVNK